jgi:MYXO-CTERM domain-containing protein
MRRHFRTLAVAALLAALAAPSAARADSDPASDTLLLQDVFLPVEPPLSSSAAGAIRGLAATMKKAGYPLKVAIIATPNDLGLVPQLFGKPQYYAAYLGREISFNAKKPLLVVMPAGYGTFTVAPNVAKALKGMKPPGSSLDSIASSTVDAMAALSKAAGHPVKKPTVSGGGSSGTSPAIIFGVPVLLLALAGALAALRRRGEEDEAGETAGEREAAAP